VTGGRGRRAVFLDRDGTILDATGYLGDPAGVRLLPGAAQALAALGAAGWLRVVVTNQSGVARGLFGTDAYRRVHAAMLAALRAGGGDLDGGYACFHHPEAQVAEWRAACDCRKPAPGMLLRAAGELGIDLAGSVMVGDAVRDMQAGRRAGCRACVLVRTGKGREEEAAARDLPACDAVIGSLAELPAWLEKGG
jgi:D-glycero-D-manno-heptose 1,7-bisphosphate phosphatase